MYFAVDDTGIGLTPGQQAGLFRLDDCYLNTGTNGEQDTGLGLLRAKTFVEKHGGSIGVESEKDVESRFWFTIPHTLPVL